MIAIARRAPVLATATILALAASAPVAAQEEDQAEAARATVSQIEAGNVDGEVRLEGAALWQLEGDGEYVFSDGTGSIAIAIDIDTATADSGIPLFELIGIDGTVAADEIDVSSWELLPIMTPAVIVPEEQVIEAYWGWIIAFGSQAPAG